MELSKDIISQFVQITNDDTKEASEKTIYGTIKEYDGSKYVQLDGSELLTPISSTTNVGENDRVTVVVKNHSAIVTGNVSSPAVRNVEVEEIGTKISEFEVIIADKVDTIELNAVNGRIDTLQSDNVVIKDTLTAVNADIRDLEADNVTIHDALDANEATIKKLEAEDVTITGKLDAVDADISSLQADNLLVRNELNANKATIDELEADNVFINQTLVAANANIERLNTEKLTATDAEIKYANIDFANIGMAAIEEFFAKSGIIDNLVVGDTTISGELVGVTIKGDLIEGGTVVADKLVVKGTNGLYYKLNTDGMKVETEQTDYNSLNGSIITAKSITATKISVKDLVAFDATIGGFKITEDSIYSGVKTTVDNTTQGAYLDSTGQVAFGDGTKFLKYHFDENGVAKLEISADAFIFGNTGTNVADDIIASKETADEAMSVAEDNSSKIGTVQLDINAIHKIIASLVVDENGSSLMSQTADGWSFNMAAFQNAINSANDGIKELNADVDEIDKQLAVLNTSVSDLSEYTDYIKLGTYEDRPSIILGETDTIFKALITNVGIHFMEGSTTPASISDGALNAEKITVSEGLYHGSNFVWMPRSNGNYGLIWKE